MLTITLPPDVAQGIHSALRRAGDREIGGVLLAEHTGHNYFTVREVTIHRRGTFASFVRHIGDAIRGLRAFFQRTGEHYERFNYLGEWHSHPLFPPEPSSQDDFSMRQIVQDPDVGATFVVLLVLRLGTADAIVGTVHTYLPDGSKHRSTLVL